MSPVAAAIIRCNGGDVTTLLERLSAVGAPQLCGADGLPLRRGHHQDLVDDRAVTD